MAELNCTCAVCGKKFHKPPSSIKKGYGLTCSPMCRAAYRTGKTPRQKPKIRRIDLADAFYDVIQGNKSEYQAAKDLGITAPTLHKWLYAWAYEGKIPADKNFLD